MNPNTDEALIEAVQSGDIPVFAQVVDRYQKKLQSFVFHMVRNDQMAQDIVQESFIHLYKTIDRVDTKRKFSSYMFSIAKNTALSYLRSLKKDISLEDIVIAQEDEALYDDLLQAERRHLVGRALQKIQKKYRHVIQLYYFDDLSYEEISTRMRLPVNTIRTHLSRAKEALRKIIPYYETR